MKTIKPHEEKFFKDIVLNGILKEISDENSNTSGYESYYKQPTKKSSKNKIIKISLLLFLLISFFLFFNLQQTPEPVKPILSKKTITHTESSTLSNLKLRPEKDEPVKNVEKKNVERKVEIKIVEKKTEKVIPVHKIEKTQRETAKALLLQQMQN